MACTKCKKGRRRSKISGMKKNNITSTVTDGLMVAGGYAAANILNNKISFIQANPVIGVILPVALGVALKGMKKGTGGCALASGMIAAGVVQGVKTFVPGIAEQVGIAGYISRSNYTPGVTGNGSSFVVD